MPVQMLVMGICDGHDAGACLADDHGILVAVSEERITRRKRQAGFPYRSIARCLDIAGASPFEVDRVAVAERSGRSVHRLLDRFYSRTDPNLPMLRRSNLASMTLQNRISGNRAVSNVEVSLSEKILRSRLSRLEVGAPIETVDHHLAHALSAARGSGFEKALVVTMDAYGDGCSGTVSLWQDGALDQRVRIPYPHSPALLYGLVASYLGYSEGEEGQVAGMAAGGDPRATRGLFDELFMDQEDSLFMKKIPTHRWLDRAIRGRAPADVAAGIQKCVQDVVGRLVGRWMERTGAGDLCLAGGLFANVRLNQVVAQACGCDDLFVFPHMGDGGLCVGAALTHCARDAKSEMISPFIGPEPGPHVSKNLPSKVDARALDESALQSIARILASGGAVGVASGRMEFGPRALGNRSILFSAQRVKLAERMGRALGRPKIMPFAPVVRECDLDKVTDAPTWKSFQFMTVTADALPGVAERFPVAVHLDGTMRIQVARKPDAPLLSDILTEYGKHVNPALLINTSFNMYSEPIVDSASRALALFQELPLAGLVLGDQYLEKRN